MRITVRKYKGLYYIYVYGIRYIKSFNTKDLAYMSRDFLHFSKLIHKL